MPQNSLWSSQLRREVDLVAELLTAKRWGHQHQKNHLLHKFSVVVSVFVINHNCCLSPKISTSSQT